MTEWSDLPHAAWRLLACMALQALDPGTESGPGSRARVVFVGADQMCAWLGYETDDAGQRALRKQVKALIDAGAIRRLNTPRRRSRAEYELLLSAAAVEGLRPCG